MAAIEAFILFLNLMFGSTTLTSDQMKVVESSPEYQAAYTADPTATQAIVIVDQNEL